MPPLVCLSPQLLDHSFPRSDIELDLVADTLAEVDELREANELHIAVPGILSLFVEEFCWSHPRQQGRLLDVQRHLAALLAQPTSRVVRIDVDCVDEWVPHPVPSGCEPDGLIAEWAEEVGRLVRRHDRSVADDGYCIGVFVCSAEAVQAGYDAKEGSVVPERCFPLVDASLLGELLDAYFWRVPADYARRVVKPRDIIAHYRQLGATVLQEPAGDDHYHLIFPQGQKWTFAQSWTELGENAIAQLRKLTGLPSAVIKYALCEGKDPRDYLEPQLRLEMCSGCNPCRRDATTAKHRRAKRGK